MRNLIPLLVLINALAVYGAVDATTKAPPTVCSSNGLSAAYDVVVVGSGIGGSVAARRLAEYNPTWKILLLERGIAYSACTACQSSANQNTITDTASGPLIFTTPQPFVAGVPMIIKDSSVQGGGSSVNTGFTNRGDAPRYYSEYFPINWNWGIMKYYYEKWENYTFPANFHNGAPWSYSADLRGRKGPAVLSQQPVRPFEQAFFGAVKSVYSNIPVYTNRDSDDGPNPGPGVNTAEIPAIGSTRVSAYTAYVRGYTGSNLVSISNVLVNRILFSNTAVTGVNITFNVPISNSSNGACVIATTRVVVSAGAYNTPKLLKLSGVGPADELARFGIPVVSNVPDVGNNLDDHFTLFNAFSGYKDNTTGSPDGLATVVYNTENDPTQELNFELNASAGGPGVVLLTILRTNLNARGTVTLASTNAADPPVIDPKYLSNPADRQPTAIAVFRMRQIAKLLNLTTINDPCAGSDCSTPNATLNTYLAKGAYFVGLHYTATASLCDVVNPESLRVAGTSGLYVLDASIMPATPGAVPMASIYAVSERGIDNINRNMHLDAIGAAVEELIGWAYCAIDSVF